MLKNKKHIKSKKITKKQAAGATIEPTETKVPHEILQLLETHMKDKQTHMKDKQTCGEIRGMCSLFDAVDKEVTRPPECIYPSLEYTNYKARCMEEYVANSFDKYYDALKKKVKFDFIESIVDDFLKDLQVNLKKDFIEIRTSLVNKTKEYYLGLSKKLSDREEFDDHKMNYVNLNENTRMFRYLERFEQVLKNVRTLIIKTKRLDDVKFGYHKVGYHAGYFIFLTLFAQSITHLTVNSFNFVKYESKESMMTHVMEEAGYKNYNFFMGEDEDNTPQDDESSYLDEFDDNSLCFKAGLLRNLKVLHFNCLFTNNDVNILNSNIEYLDISDSLELFQKNGDVDNFSKFFGLNSSYKHMNLDKLKVLVLCNSFYEFNHDYSIKKLKAMLGLIENGPHLTNLEYVLLDGYAFENFRNVEDTNNDIEYSLYDITDDNFMVPEQDKLGDITYIQKYEYFHTLPEDKRKDKISTLTNVKDSLNPHPSKKNAFDAVYLIHIHKNIQTGGSNKLNISIRNVNEELSKTTSQKKLQFTKEAKHLIEQKMNTHVPKTPKSYDTILRKIMVKLYKVSMKEGIIRFDESKLTKLFNNDNKTSQDKKRLGETKAKAKPKAKAKAKAKPKPNSTKLKK